MALKKSSKQSIREGITGVVLSSFLVTQLTWCPPVCAQDTFRQESLPETTGLEELTSKIHEKHLGGMEESAPQRLKKIAAWIGTPSGRGQLKNTLPAFDQDFQVNTFEADGALGTRRIRLLKLLGSGLAGTVYLAEDTATGARFVEKHYGLLPVEGSKSLGRGLAAALTAVSRQAPLSFRELPEAAVALQLANWFVIASSLNHFGYAITPPILYTRYDPDTGGYVHALPYIEGRPLQPWNPDLPLMGEAALFRKTMEQWRDFLGEELGFWGIMRQVDPSNFNAYSNLWITPDHHVLLLDIVPGIPGIEPKYLWMGIERGEFPPFADAMDLDRLARFMDEQPLYPKEPWRENLALLRAALARWKASEPRLISSPSRLRQVLSDPETRQTNQEALLTHLEVKGAISPQTAQENRDSLNQTGRFPKSLLHAVLKMFPLAIHRFLTDGAYAVELILQSWRLPWNLGVGALSYGWKALSFLGGSLRLFWHLFVDSEARLQYAGDVIGGWIREAQLLGRLTNEQAARLRENLREKSGAADLSSLFVIHLSLKAIFPIGTGTAGLVLLIPAVLTGQWWLATPAVAPSLLRFASTLWILGLQYPGVLLMSALPEIGTAAAPLSLLKHQPELGGFMIRSLAQETAMKIPGFGERGSWTEMASTAAAQVLLVDPAPLLAPVAVVTAIGLGVEWPWLAWGAGAVYLGSVVWSIVTRWRPAPSQSVSVWNFGVPARYLEPLPVPPLSSQPSGDATKSKETAGLEETGKRPLPPAPAEIQREEALPEDENIAVPMAIAEAEAATADRKPLVVLDVTELERFPGLVPVLQRMDQFTARLILLGSSKLPEQFMLRKPKIRWVTERTPDAVLSALGKTPDLTEIVFFGGAEESYPVRVAAATLGLAFSLQPVTLESILRGFGVSGSLSIQIAAELGEILDFGREA